jgi:hypothetical protein
MSIYWEASQALAGKTHAYLLKANVLAAIVVQQSVEAQFS